MSKECIYCRSEIHDKAVKCKECDGYQNWRKYLNFSSNILSLLIALISVLTMSIPIIINEVKSDSSRITFNIIEEPKFTAKVQDYGDGLNVERFSTIKYNINFPILIANSGNKSGFLYRVEASVKDGHGKLDLFPRKDNTIKPNSVFTEMISIELDLKKYDKVLRGWKVAIVDRGEDLREEFGKVYISLTAMNELGEIYKVKEFSYDFGNQIVAIQMY